MHDSRQQALPSIHPLQIQYYDPTHKVARLEQQLEAARVEIDRLRTHIAEIEKDRSKSDTPKIQSRYWTQAEHQRFLDALRKFGPKDVRAIASYVGSRNATQVRTHAQKYFLRVAKKNGSALANARKRSMSESDLARVGGSVRTPPGSPKTSESNRTCLTSQMQMSTDLPVSAAKPPPLAKRTSSMSAEMADSSGINLLSLVASERKIEEMGE